VGDWDYKLLKNKSAKVSGRRRTQEGDFSWARRLTGHVEHCRRDGCRERSRCTKLGMGKYQAEGFGAVEG